MMLKVLLAIAVSRAQADVTQVHVFVKGMVCAFCANGLKHVIEKEEAVATSQINLENKELKIFIKDGRQLSDSEIQAAVKKAGFEVSRIER